MKDDKTKKELTPFEKIRISSDNPYFIKPKRKRKATTSNDEPRPAYKNGRKVRPSKYQTKEERLMQKTINETARNRAKRIFLSNAMRDARTLAIGVLRGNDMAPLASVVLDMVTRYEATFPPFKAKGAASPSALHCRNCGCALRYGQGVYMEWDFGKEEDICHCQKCHPLLYPIPEVWEELCIDRTQGENGIDWDGTSIASEEFYYTEVH